ncbi:AAA family ATPase [Chlorogloea sp. CCALA 695]|uniref:AAA family ATPase n=1 Tax=Chlorogloea sp. CCALA 695 TaxID=2107693 RepID=UPI000D07F4CC|nr:AAA family ATPase [Chlorogloea sp. CCALA 695]PSB32591.1 ATP-binding protein [Chlorogloea sp. CCALA 695]
MKLMSIQLNNFRQFYSMTPEIILAGGERNTTVIHGNNGAGKTTLLNAFTWVLYEKFTAAFGVEDQLVNKRAISEVQIGESVECWVNLVFEHDGKRYRFRRSCYGYRTNDKIEHTKSKLSPYIAADDGRWVVSHQLAEDIIGRILPETLYQYFFFDGERIERIVRDEKKGEIAEATKELLGIKVLNRAVEHLKAARRTLEDELKIIGDSETKKLLKEQKSLETKINELLARQKEISTESQYQEEIRKNIGERLLELSGAGELQSRRDQLEQQGKLLKEQLKQAKDILKRVISTRGYTVLLSDVTAEFRNIIDGLRERGELPTGIKRQFVGDLLEQKRCICGAELINGTHAHHLVESWLDKAGSSDVEEIAIRMGAQVDEIDKQVPEFWQEVDRQQDNIKQYRTDISTLENELDTIREKLINYPDEDIQQLQKRLDITASKICDLILEQGANQQKVDDLTIEVGELVKQVSKQKMNEQKQALAQRRITAAQEATECLIEVRKRLEQQFRLLLEQKVQQIFAQISFTPYIPKLSEKYELTLIENTTWQNATVAASTGENQILSLSFIGAIIDRVREWSENKLLMVSDSSTFPIVMDSPFGTLDEMYRRQIAKTIPNLANQLVVLVTKTQWRGEVAQEMANYIGREYILTYNSPKLDCEEDSIVIGSDRYPLVKQSPNEFEYTEIIEVQRHDYSS